jgi:hypothetical protein
MHPIRSSCLLAFVTVLSLAADEPAWKSKPLAQWDAEDAKQVLADSPWSKTAHLERLRDLSVSEREQSGNWEADTGHGVGLAGIDLFGISERSREAVARAHQHPDPGYVVVRWESAQPVRAAEMKLGESGIPNWRDYYAIAVHEVPYLSRWNLAAELKGVAFLQRDKKKDLRPKRVEIVHHEKGPMTVVYLFSRANEIARKDANVRFVAQIGRLYVSQFFFPSEMEFEGNQEF